jgi:hypothetical protein
MGVETKYNMPPFDANALAMCLASTDVRIAKIEGYITKLEERLTMFNKVSGYIFSNLEITLDDDSNMPKKRMEAKLNAHKVELQLVKTEKLIYIMWFKGKLPTIKTQLYKKYDDLTFDAMSAYEAVMATNKDYTDKDYIQYIKDTSFQRDYIKKICGVN